MTRSEEVLFEAIDRTWPPAKMFTRGQWQLRAGAGGGKRVSAATARGAVSAGDITDAEDAMRDMGQNPLFMLRGDDGHLDQALSARGYKVIDPVVVLTAPVAALTDITVPPVTCFTVWEPLAIMHEIWAQGGIGPERLAVMRRAKVKTGLFARCNNKPAGCGFVSVAGRLAMVHAVEVLPDLRRQGVAGWIMRQAAFWARGKGATEMAVLCTRANTGALGLYSSLGFEKAAEYHYRHIPNVGD